MRNFLTIIAMLAFQVGISQSNPQSVKLNAAMSPSEIGALSADQLDQLSYFANSGFRVHDTPKPGSAFANLSSVLKAGKTAPDYANINQENFNPLIFDFGSRADHQFFLIDGTDRVIQIYSADYCNMRYEQVRTTRENAKKIGNKK